MQSKPALLGCVLLAIVLPVVSSQPVSSPVRVWLEELYFSPAETVFLRTEIHKSRGRLVAAGGAGGGLLADRGADVVHAWDIYFTNRRQCYTAYPKVSWPQRVNCLPGTEAISLKKSLIHTMQAAYGDDAISELMPRSYLLPEQYLLWREWAQQSGAPIDQTWVLKTNVHRGKGVHLHGLADGLDKVSASLSGLGTSGSATPPVGSAANSHVPQPAPAYVLAQQYVSPQFQYEGRQCYVRVWAVITSVNPLRVYVYSGGVLIFGAPKGASTDNTAESGNTAPGTTQGDAGIVNLWQQTDRNTSMTWSFGQLRAYLIAQYQEEQAARQQASDGEDGAQQAVRRSRRRPVSSMSGTSTTTATFGGRKLQSRITRTGISQRELQRRRRAAVKVRRAADVARLDMAPGTVLRPGLGRSEGPTDRFDYMKLQIQNVIGLAVAAGLPAMRAAGSSPGSLMDDAPWDAWGIQPDGSGGTGLRPPLDASSKGTAVHGPDPGGPRHNAHVYTARPAGYELLGVDFLLGADMTPHLLEINSLPSMAPLDPCGDREACAAAAEVLAADELALLTQQDEELRQAQQEAAELGLPVPGRAAASKARRLHGRAAHGDPTPAIHAGDAHGGGTQDLSDTGTGGRDSASSGGAVGGSSSDSVDYRAQEGQEGTRAGGAAQRSLQQAGDDDGRTAGQQQAYLPRKPFDLQKHGAVHGLLGLLGAPVHRGGAAGVRAAVMAARKKRGGLLRGPPQFVQGFGPAWQPGSGAVLSIVAAMLAVELQRTGATASSASPTFAGGGNPAENGHVVAGNASVVLETLGARYPKALEAAKLATPRMKRFMCPGLPHGPTQDPGPGSGQRPRCPVGCLWLPELQVIGELELELTGRGGWQPVYPMQEAMEENTVARVEARARSTGPPTPPRTLSWHERWSAWTDSTAGRAANSKWLDPATAGPQHVAPLRLDVSDLDALTSQVVRTRQAMVRGGQLRACLRDGAEASNCAVVLVRQALADRCTDSNTDW